MIEADNAGRQTTELHTEQHKEDKTMKIGIIIPPFRGHLNPSLSLGRALKKYQGLEVAVICFPEVSSAVEHAGLEFIAIGHDIQQDLLDLTEEMVQLQGMKAFQKSIEHSNLCVATRIAELPNIIADHSLDALLIDEVCQEAWSIAEKCETPYGIICNAMPFLEDPAIPPFSTTWKYSKSFWSRCRNRLMYWFLGCIVRTMGFLQPIEQYRKTQGLPEITLEARRHQGVFYMCQMPSALDFPRERIQPHFFHTGPWHEPDRDTNISFPFEKLNKERPIIYASLGTLKHKQVQDIYRMLIQACSDLEQAVQLILVVGKKGAELDFLPPLPEDNSVLAVDYAPQLAVLEHATVLVTHAGQNTALEGLGLPMVAIPLSHDQPGIASRLSSAGAAKLVSAEKATAAIFRTVLEEVLTNPSYREASQRLKAQVVRESPTMKQIAEAICVGLEQSGPSGENKFYRASPDAVRILGDPPTSFNS